MLGLGALDTGAKLVKEIGVIDIIRSAKVAPREDVEIVDLDPERLDVVGEMPVEVICTGCEAGNECTCRASRSCAAIAPRRPAIHGSSDGIETTPPSTIPMIG